MYSTYFDSGRLVAARIVWGIAAFAAACLMIAAILIALKANPSNELVQLIKNLADFFSLGLFSLHNPIIAFHGTHGAAWTALVNYGIIAVLWLVVGKLVAGMVAA